ncbi:glycosyltransferase [Paracrocinitomix mangrovi]|uniref:glycosyltransferase n=1 Tax=Paracrocinitomix mangrovi TaxID=2862509 RepID=UPI001EDB1AC3|nr:glycosyltransferase [Paracrocinitomix mangrovi]UKN03075.1 glycosyltransferase [Paracrocinitomix mangrovi]
MKESTSDKKNILILPRWYPNKTDIQLGSFIQQQALLLKDNFNIEVIYVQAIENQGQVFDIETDKSNGITEHTVYFRSAKGPLKKIINARRYKKAQQMAYIIDVFKADLCHVHVPYRSAFLALKLNKQGVPFVITEHWSGHLTGAYQQKNPADKKLYQKVLAKSAGISTVSKLLQTSFKKNTGFNSVVIPNLINSVNSNSPFNSENIEILTVADLYDETKNLSGLIEAFKIAFEENSALRLSIIGGGPDEEKLKDLVNSYNLSNEVKFLGRKPYEETLQSYSNCHFYICNSNFETFGMAVAEALNSGKPVISTMCGGPEEFLNDNNSILVNVGDTDQLATAILRMADLFQNFNSSEIQAEIKSKFGPEIIKSQLTEFYDSAIHNSSVSKK